MNAEGRIVLLAGRRESTNVVYHALADEFDIARVIIEEPVARVPFLKRRAKNVGLAKVIGQVLFRAIVPPLLRAISRRRRREIMQEYGLNDAPIPPEKVTHVASVNADETIALLKALDPAVVVINGTRIIASKVLTAIPARFLNTHAGITPLYRGVHGAYWALTEGDRAHAGVTVHFVDPGIDTGGILEQGRIEPTARDNFATYPLLQLGVGLPLLRKAIRDVLEGRAEVKPAPEGASRLWVHPTLWEYVVGRVRRGVK